MKRIRKTAWMVVTMLSILALTACDREEEKIKNLSAYVSTEAPNYTLYNYDGEWTVDKQVADTARLSIRNDLAAVMLEFPVIYLSNLFFQNEDSLIVTQWYLYPLNLTEQAFSEIGNYHIIIPADRFGESEYIIGGFQVTKNRITKEVMLITNEMGNGIYRLDTGLWTISFTISSYYISNGATGESSLNPLPEPITLYYNAKKRIE